MSPLYEYECPKHGRFERLVDINQNGNPAVCPECGETSAKVISRPAVISVQHKERLPLGTGSRGKYIPPEGERHGILVPSWGAMEHDEVEYTAHMALEIEESRVKNRAERPRRQDGDQKELLGKVTEAALRAPQGQRAATIQNCIKGIREGRQV